MIGAVLTLIIAVAVPVYWTRETTRQRGVEAELELKALEDGAVVYIANCASCHGDYGEGTVDGPPVQGTVLEIADIEKATAEGTQAFPSAAHIYSRDRGGPLNTTEIGYVAFFIKNWDTEVMQEVRGDAKQIDVEVYEYIYEPSQIEVKVGEPVRLVLVNVGQLRHAWRLDGGEVEVVDEGPTDDVFLELEPRVPTAVEFVPLKKGTLTFYCPVPGHAERGEVGTLVVVD